MTKIAIWKFTSCDGCQLSLLDLEEDLLEIAKHFEISYFLEASSKRADPPYDISLVEGSITTEEAKRKIMDIRAQSKYLVTIGACATAGGIQALRNFASLQSFKQRVYPRPEVIDVLPTSLPISHYVRVDYELQGCPINKLQLLQLLYSYSRDLRPSFSSGSVCMECKRRAIPCVMVASKTLCLGPVTHGGCGAICPSFGRGCYGCYGPKETPNSASLCQWAKDELDFDPLALDHAFKKFYCIAEGFKLSHES
ncbi:NADH-quinone oxidoreductase subunit B family protein [Methylacidiphilum caldifontis]|uniref:Oxidoreductase n=1 Tax=Methylacidiphilum caldifontis TaxID=2795386 RepID=A0A4Y8PC04_9BACT|nr:oxidoreductase [Methylacidiphilum caldifontis]QSR87965.1 oxidoreductase [Methylacidiphilum caldifontis]TFE68726.1 oxidoreductase [Methylacidiphilum caldifontis]